MALSAGTRLGVYEILRLLGVGGMGEVYRARDSKLGRDVAIKVLPPLFTRDPERLTRFEREARVLAALNHPNIGAIYGVEDPGPEAGANATRALVLELVEGETLDERIGRGTADSNVGDRASGGSRVVPRSRRGVSVAEALRMAGQVAEALEAAHEKGIVHRDLKPANIKITPAGLVKVLDFGLAKAAMGEVGPSADVSHYPTVAVEGTRAGMILGTAGYMSPEQTRGSVVDKRADIWAFGCVLYEMLTGRPAFAKDNVSDTIAAILEREPDWAALPLRTPPKIRDLLRRCLQKDPSRRLHDIADARVEIDDVRLGLIHPRARSRARAITGIVGILAIAAIALLWLRPSRGLPPNGSEWVQITNFPDAATQPALSPDGRMLTFIRGAGTFTTDGQIYLKMLPDGEAVPLTSDKLTKMSPAFSPDGSRIAYGVVRGTWDTWVVPTLRGEPRLWLRNVVAMTWLAKDQLLYSEIKRGQHMGIVTSGENRAGARDVYVPEHELGMAHRSYLAPDRASVLVVEMDERGVWIPCRLVPFDGRSSGKAVGPPNSRCTDAAWAPDGKWMYFTADTGDGFHLWRQAYPNGQPERITSGITQEEGLAIAPDGKSLITSVGFRRRAIFVRSADGDERQIPAEGYAFWPILSADGRRLCYRVARGGGTGQTPTELWMTDLETGRTDRLLPTMAVTSYDLSRDDRIVAGIREPDGKNNVWTAWLDGREPARRVPNVEGDNPRWVGAGDIAFRAHDGTTMFLFRAKTDGTGLQKLTESAGLSAVIGSASPDGRWLSGVQSPEGTVTSIGVRAQLYSMNDAKPVLLMPSSPTVRVRWAPDGKHIYVSIQTGETSSFGGGRTYVLPTKGPAMLPRVPAGGFRSEAELAAVPGAVILPYGDVAPGPFPSIYAFSRETVTRNLYRIPLP